MSGSFQAAFAARPVRATCRARLQAPQPSRRRDPPHSHSPACALRCCSSTAPFSTRIMHAPGTRATARRAIEAHEELVTQPQRRYNPCALVARRVAAGGTPRGPPADAGVRAMWQEGPTVDMRGLAWWVAACVVVLALGGTAWAYDYETCFAFDPVFVQADQRRVAQATPEEGQSRPPSEPKEGRPPAPRLSLKTLRGALQAASAMPEKPEERAAKGGRPQ